MLDNLLEELVELLLEQNLRDILYRGQLEHADRLDDELDHGVLCRDAGHEQGRSASTYLRLDGTGSTVVHAYIRYLVLLQHIFKGLVVLDDAPKVLDFAHDYSL